MHTLVASAAFPGNLGLTSATRTVLDVYRAAWADASPVLQARTAAFAATCARHLAIGGDPAPGLKGAAEARQLLITEGCLNALLRGLREVEDPVEVRALA